jgi:hypothetical protein
MHPRCEHFMPDGKGQGTLCEESRRRLPRAAGCRPVHREAGYDHHHAMMCSRDGAGRRGGRMKPSLTFWYDLASPYSWLAAEPIETLAAQARVAVAWRPFLLGPIFAAHGRSNSPFNLFPAKGRNMWRDLERQCTPHEPANDREARPLSAKQPSGRPGRDSGAGRHARAIHPYRLPGAIHAGPPDRRPRRAGGGPR